MKLSFRIVLFCLVYIKMIVRQENVLFHDDVLHVGDGFFLS